MIEVFRTNIHRKSIAKKVVHLLNHRFGYTNVAFDLKDCDKVLRIKAEEIQHQSILELFKQLNLECEALPD